MMARQQREARSTLKRGADAMETLKKEQEQAEARREASQHGVFRFFVSKNDRGSGYKEHEIVILDDDARNAPFAHEHTIPGPGNNFKVAKNHICVDEVDNCVLCRAREQNLGDEYGFPSYSMYMTVLDLTPYTIKNGPRAGQVIEASRKLYVVPSNSVGDFMKMFELAMKNHGTTRGMTMVVTKSKQTDPRCGRPQMLDNGMLFDMLSEEELEDYANEAVVRDGKTIKEEGEDIEPLDYERELAPPDQRVLRKLYNLPAAVGSEEEEEAETGRSRRQRRRAGISAEESASEDPPARTRRRASRQADDENLDDGAGDGAGDEEQEDPPARTRRSRTSSRRQEPEEDQPPAPARRRARQNRAEDQDIPF